MALASVVRVPRPLKCSETELAYAAGFFDGEGHIAIIHRKPKYNGSPKSKYERYVLQCTLSQNRRPVMDWYCEKFGGSAHLVAHKRSYDSVMTKRYDWHISTAAAADFLRAIRPWLIVKAVEADIALEFQASTNLRTGKVRLSQEVWNFRAECHRRIREARRVIADA